MSFEDDDDFDAESVQKWRVHYSKRPPNINLGRITGRKERQVNSISLTALEMTKYLIVL